MNTALAPMTWLALAAAGVGVDLLLGEPRRWHPLVGFGRVVRGVESLAMPWVQRLGAGGARLIGVACVGVLVAVPAWAALALLSASPVEVQLAGHVALLAFALGGRSLADHVLPIAAALERGDLPAARTLAGRIVSRDLADADEAAVARAAVESTLENGNDAVFGALFWFLLAGGPGALAFRLANTLDAMWGYRTPRYLHFGWAAARLDDGLNLLPARLTAISYALLGRTALALQCWRQQARAWQSPNAGPVMAAGAGALGVRLGGAACYGGRLEHRPPLGQGGQPGAADIRRALALVRRSVALWFAVGLVAAWLLDGGAVRC